MSDEIELKLELAPEDAETLCKQPLFCDSPRQFQQQHSVYYDTPRGKLRKHGFTLRVRATDAGFVQTVKTVEFDAAGLFFRGEWETAVGSLEPFVEQLNQTPAGDVGAKKLQPVITADVQRTIWCSERHGVVLEFALDDGELKAGKAKARLCELEIELLKGSPKDAFDAARAIAANVPIKLGVLSKAERGFALADGLLEEPTKASPVPVRAEMSMADGFAVIAQSCLRHFRLNEPLVVEKRDPAALHQARVAMRRLRSALSLFKPAVADNEYPRLREQLRWLTGQLGEARNLDVYLQRNVSGNVREALVRNRERAYDNVIEVLNSKRFRLLMIDFLRWLALGHWRSGDKATRPLPEYGGKRIDRLWQRIGAHGDLRKMDDLERHDVRIEIKRLRYGLEFLHALHDHDNGRQKQFLKAAEGLQETLGHLNDIVTGRELSEQGFPASDAADLAGEPRLLAQAEQRFRRLKKLGAYWTKRPDPSQPG